MNDKLWRRIPPLGMVALAAFVVCAVTGIMLVPVYKPDAPLDSLALLLLKNPAGSFVRSLHYWAAQAFLVCTLAHIVDHLLRRSETNVQFGVWLRLALTVPVVLGAMLSGFLLRGDTTTLQALQVLRTMLTLVPLVGAGMSRLLTGSGQDLFTVYLHHACTATLVIWLVTIDHSRRIMPSARALWWILPGVLLPALFLVPALEWRAAAVEKGPWYLIGLQELLHWLPQPQLAVWLLAAGLVLLAVLPRLPLTLRSRVKWGMAVAAFAYVVLTIVGICFRGQGWELKSPLARQEGSAQFLSFKAYVTPDAALVKQIVPMVAGQREGCLVCHQGMTGFSTAHETKTLGCAACHLGNPFTLNKSLAHAGMTLTPGNLSVVNQTCGTANCHGSVADRVHQSMMNTMSGVVAVDKFVFAESRNLDVQFDVAALKHSPADTHLRTLCASCHLGQDKLQPGPIDESSRGGGCSACHLRYDAAARSELRQRGGKAAPLHHPDISVNVEEQACFGCHSRSGRIATSYEGWHETLLDEATAKTSPSWPAQFRLLADGRIFETHPADVHFEKGMKCIDCHGSAEIMGDGAPHAHERNAVKIACEDCHTASGTPAKEFAQLDGETQIVISLRKLNVPGRRFVVSGSGSVAYTNMFLDADGRPQLVLKESAKVLTPKPPSAACARDRSMHPRLDCAACHTSWAPQCIRCHTSFDSKEQAWDYLDGKFVQGEWEEQATDYLGDAPALGVVSTVAPSGKIEEHVTTFIPGMILNLDLPNGDKKNRNVFRRLFAPASSHTIVAHARDCRSCHANPAALGYGRGQMKYATKGTAREWQFTPAFQRRSEDGLQQDAWIGFLREPEGKTTTRNDARPFTLQEQQRILLVGACLQCHNAKEPRLALVFSHFTNYRNYLSPLCRVPEWAIH